MCLIFATLLKSYRNPTGHGNAMTVIEIKNGDFFDLKGEQEQGKLKVKGRPMLADIVEAKFSRGTTSVFFKTDYNAPTSSEFDFLKKCFKLQLQSKLLRDQPRGIRASKCNDILKKLCQLMPASRQIFWNKISTNDESADLIDNFD